MATPSPLSQLKPSRIAIVNERWTAGATRAAKDLLRGLQSRHHVAYFPNGPQLSSTQQLDALAQFQPDLVHLHSFYGDLPYSFLAKVANRYPTAFTLHDPRPLGDILLPCWNCQKFATCFSCPLIGHLKRFSLFKHQHFLSRLHKRRVHSQLPASTTIISPSLWMDDRARHSELARLRTAQIYNGVDLQLFSHDPLARQSLGIPENQPVLTFVAHHSGWSLDERKGIHILAKALTDFVLPRFPNLLLLAVGGGLVPNLPNLRPIGFVPPDQLARYYSAANLFIAPSLADNLPYTILEAMACSTPVVASRVGGIPEQVVHDSTGRLFTPGDPADLGKNILDLLENPQLASAMGLAARDRASSLFSLAESLAQHESLFASMLAP